MIRVTVVPNVGSVNGARYPGRDTAGWVNTLTESVTPLRKPGAYAEPMVTEAEGGALAARPACARTEREAMDARNRATWCGPVMATRRGMGRTFPGSRCAATPM